MKLVKAIEICFYSSVHDTILLTPDDKDALKLLIEAGKHYKEVRSKHCIVFDELLPGETKD